ncbi:MAG: ABC transporter ATP-binding protein [Cyanobacteria bacterium]|nr:ABC transporter ATP-binding protein [Cyanobacteriota bacterium]
MSSKSNKNFGTLSSSTIELRKVQKSFMAGDEKIQVLFDIDLTVQPGELTFLVGPSGCGKTTLISIIAGILQADSGEINVFGQSLEKMNDGQKTKFRKANVGFIFQQFNLVPTLSVTENVAMPLVIQGVPRLEAFQRARKILEEVQLSKRADFSPNQLSGGEQQRVAIARALVSEPRLLVCDEPTAALDGKNGQLVIQLIKSLSVKADRCVLVVSHDNRIFGYGDSIVEMEDGRILQIRHPSNESSAK